MSGPAVPDPFVPDPPVPDPPVPDPFAAGPITVKLVRRFGPAVAAWVAGLADLVDTVARRWDIAVGAPFAGGASSVAIRATTADGRAAVLKLSPDLPVVAEQVAVLRLFAPSGRVPEVWAADVDLGAVLLARVRPGTEVRDLPTPPTPTAYADLLTALHGVHPPDPGVLSGDLLRWTNGFTHRAIDRLDRTAADAGLHRSDFERALRLRDRLLAAPSPVVLLHGDLHLGNVLDGGRHGLMAIDPRSILGDPCFDAVDYVVDGAGRDGDGIGFRLAGLASAAGLDPDRLHAWCRMVAPVTALSLVRAGGPRRAVDELLTLGR